jgi:hypothetical protein
LTIHTWYFIVVNIHASLVLVLRTTRDIDRAADQSQITATNPNRVTLVSGSINVPGSPQDKDQGGVYIDNNEVPGMYRQLYLLSIFVSPKP